MFLLPSRPTTKPLYSEVFWLLCLVLLRYGVVGAAHHILSRLAPLSYTHHPKVQPGFFFVPWCELSETQAATVSTQLPRAVILGNSVSGIPSSRKPTDARA